MTEITFDVVILLCDYDSIEKYRTSFSSFTRPPQDVNYLSHVES